MIVVDTNVISYFFLTSEYSERAEQLYMKEPEWAAPFLWRSEFRNVLATYMRRELLRLPDAIEIFEGAERLLAGMEYDVSSIQVLRLTALSGCSAYDCEFVLLAQDLGVPLVTMDKKLLYSFPDSCLSILDMLD